LLALYAVIVVARVMRAESADSLGVVSFDFWAPVFVVVGVERRISPVPFVK
jgi:hypothetical protein